MTNLNTERGEVVASATREEGLYEVCKGLAPNDPPFIGYFNGQRSVTSDRADVALRGLHRKHAPRKVVPFAEGVARQAAKRATETGSPT